ncbi:MAG TPA: hypothetical protein VK612_09220 [Pyrinomonadaceae bacterium]|nr:hypothetical protein [Pyrinomonadaceae bacterium]
MAERTSSMGSKTMLSRMLFQETITGNDREIATVHEINRQSAVKEIIVHVFFMSKFGVIDPPLTVGEAKSQYYRATGNDQAAHNAPGQILAGNTPIQELLSDDVDLQITVENLFGKTDGIHSRFNKADSRAEENGLRDALCTACNFIAQAAKSIRFNRASEIHSHLGSAFDVYKTAGVAAFRAAAMRQRALMKRNDPDDVRAREETIAILDFYRTTLETAWSTHETVLGLFPEDIWRQYSQLGK